MCIIKLPPKPPPQAHNGPSTLAINDVLMQVTADHLPFGGIGESGMGHYHGIEGFKTFSHARNTLVSGKFNLRTQLLLKQNKLLITLLKWMYLRR